MGFRAAVFIHPCIEKGWGNKRFLQGCYSIEKERKRRVGIGEFVNTFLGWMLLEVKPRGQEWKRNSVELLALHGLSEGILMLRSILKMKTSG